MTNIKRNDVPASILAVYPFPAANENTALLGKLVDEWKRNVSYAMNNWQASPQTHSYK